MYVCTYVCREERRKEAPQHTEKGRGMGVTEKGKGEEKEDQTHLNETQTQLHSAPRPSTLEPL
jgi:hypothetical protein